MRQIITYYCLFLSITAFTQTEKFTISGYIEDAGSDEKLISVNIFDSKTGSAT